MYQHLFELNKSLDVLSWKWVITSCEFVPIEQIFLQMMKRLLGVIYRPWITPWVQQTMDSLYFICSWIQDPVVC